MAQAEKFEAKPEYRVKEWLTNEVMFSLYNVLTIRYIAEKSRIYFLDDKDEPLSNLPSILDLLKPMKDEKAYLEWCDNTTGKYFYFNITDLMLKFNSNQLTYIDTGLLLQSIQATNSSNSSSSSSSAASALEEESKESPSSAHTSDSHYYKFDFDESELLKNKLHKRDVLVLSPLRSLTQIFSPMIKIEGSTLYVGPKPSKEFVFDCSCNVIFNCTNASNSSDIVDISSVEEEVFSVSDWRWGSNDKDKYAILDAKVDYIYEKLSGKPKQNVLVHCLAGAHRSPFVAGCVLAKYCSADGNFRGESDVDSKVIYEFMQSKRSIVEPLSYGQELQQYIKFLKLCE